MKAVIKNHFKEKYYENLNQIQDIIKILDFLPKKKTFIAGGFAAWAVGRFTEFGDLDIFVFDDYKFYIDTLKKLNFISNISHDYKKKFHIYDKDYNISGKLTQVQIIFKNISIEKMFNIFDLSCISIFINLHDINEIYSKECLCDYEKHKQYIDIKLDRCYPILYFKNYIRSYVPKRINKYLYRMKKKNIYTLSMLDYECQDCIKRNMLIKKYIYKWKHKTYKIYSKKFYELAEKYKNPN